MKRVGWATDIHLNFLGTQQIEHFLDNLVAEHLDAFIISGDIGEATSLEDYLTRIASHLHIPIYFVLGNHDYYHGSIAHVRHRVQQLCSTTSNLHWLPDIGVIELTADVALVGHGGWGDGRLGDYARSTLMLNDYILIQELAGLSPMTRLDELNRLGDEAAAYFRQWLPDIFSKYSRVFIVTHVPPFKDSCWHNGQISDDNFLPHFTCQAVGNVLWEWGAQYPDCEVTVLCGHTHSDGNVHILPNMQVLTGGAEYGSPCIRQVFEA